MMPDSVDAVVPEPRLSRQVARLHALSHRMQMALLFVVAAVVAASMVIFIRVVLTAHQVPRWQEDLARILPFLD
jgi:putative exporter of polyketide antibiotics